MAERHHLKTWPQFFHAVARGDKTFEVRKDDRAFQAGDTLVLEYFDPAKPQDTLNFAMQYEPIERLVTFVLHGGQFGVEEGYVIMGLSVTPSYGAPV